MKPSIGFIGLGLMGKPMSLNLVKAGYTVTVWNRTASRADEVVAAGATLAKSPREVAAHCDFLITIVSDPPALEEVLWGAAGPSDGALSALKAGSIYMDSSTVSPGAGAQDRRRLRETAGAVYRRSGNGRGLGRKKGRIAVYAGRRCGNDQRG